MKRLGFLLLPSVVVLGMIWIVFWANPTFAVPPPPPPPPANSASNADYIATPPFLSTFVTPNVLIMLDNSGSMGYRAICDGTDNGSTPYSACPTSPQIYGPGAPAGAPFMETVAFIGTFDSLSCYTYDATAGNTRFVVTTTKATISSACAATDWDGNFLNWATFRRHDALIKALIGGACATARLTDASCPPIGSPALITMKVADAGLSSCCANASTFPTPPGACVVPPATVSCANGRIPTAVQSLVTTACPACNIVIHTISASAGSQVAGGFCVGRDDTARPGSGNCGITGAPTPGTTGEYLVHVAVAVEPPGVIQDLGDKVRMGLLEFRNSGDGGKVLVPIGWTLATTYNLTPVTAYSSNKQAMVAAIEQTAAATGTPLAETLYTGIRYIAQLPQPFSSTVYYYPCAFSGCGPAFPSSTTTAGSLGPITAPAAASEPTQLVTGDACPTTLGYVAGACGRDPYYFGSNPSWANPSSQIVCCNSFIMFLTDGEANQDTSIPAALQDYAHVAHGSHCAGSWAGPPADNPTATDYGATTTCFNSNTNAIAPAVLLQKHKVDYSGGSLASPSVNHTLDDVAYWGHVNDLRQATVPVVNETGHDLAGFQNVTIYPIFAFGNINGRELLMQAAKQGGFTDQDNDTLGPGGVHSPNLQAEWDAVDNVTGLLVPDGIPDTYFESQNANQMRDKILAAFISILQQSASGTTVSVLATSSTGEGAIYHAYFFPTTFVNLGTGTNIVAWTGFTEGLFIDKFGNIREDYSAPGCTGPPDGKMVLTHDCIIRVRLETDPTSSNFESVVIDRFKDDGSCVPTTSCVAGDGLADTATPFQTVAVTTGGQSNVQPIWEAGRRLALLSPGATCESSNTWPKAGNLTESGRNCRRILTWADINNDGLVGGTERLEFTNAGTNTFTLCPYLGAKTVVYCNSTNAAAIVAADITTDPNLTGCLGLTRKTCAQNEATSIINWIRGSSVTGLRDRTFNVVNDSGGLAQAQWKLGDVVNATPTAVGAPITRYDVLYGDATYAQFFKRYKDRRQVVYVGANDGMLHAFNAGFFTNDDRQIDGTGPIVQARFSATPKQIGTSTDCAALPCDGSVTTYNFRSDAPPLGAELWSFIPQDLLPQLRWLTLRSYGHVYYVDLTPKVTDARIFPVDADHPGGWGTILIGGFRLGGSCNNCTSGKGTARVVQSDFNYNGTTTDTGNGTSGSDYRVFLSSYFVLDITNPEKEPTLLWVFRDDDLGLTTVQPSIVRTNPSTDATTSSTNERWFAIFGSGPTHYDYFSTQAAQYYAIDLKLGPSYADVNRTLGSKGKGKKAGQACPAALPCMAVDQNVAGGAVRAFDTVLTGGLMVDSVTIDYNLDFRVDSVYGGYVVCNGTTTSSGCGGSNPIWIGAMLRLTTNGGNPDPDTWGIACSGGGCSNNLRLPTAVISSFPYTTPQATTCVIASPCTVGPITAAPTLTQDDNRNLWIFFGTGRFFTSIDKTSTDIQHFFGVKDPCIVSGGCASQLTQRNNLFNSSNIVTCTSCVDGTNVSTTGSTASFTTGYSSGSGNLVNNIQNMDGWFTTFNDPTAPLQTPSRSATTPGERNLSPATLLGGTVFFTTFVPTTDICKARGTGYLYAVYYLTGGPYTASAIGTVTSGTNTLAAKSLSLGQGLPTQMQIHIGAELPTSYVPPTPGDCAGSRTIGITQTSTGAAAVTCLKPAKTFYSRMVSWRDL